MLLLTFLKNTGLPVALYLGNVKNWSFCLISLYALPLPDKPLVRDLKDAQRPYNPPNQFPSASPSLPSQSTFPPNLFPLSLSLPSPSPLVQSAFPPKPPLHLPRLSGEEAKVNNFDDKDEDEYGWSLTVPVDDQEIPLPEDGSALAEEYLSCNTSCASDNQKVPFLEGIDDVVSHQFGYIQTNDTKRQLFSEGVWKDIIRALGYGQKYMPSLEALES
ncbi:hypothetical protein GYMLUDRAFT_239416 [Collybiopsis luxurians FD-317 M1]|nr:hypothetical protein GYMLUDRAFT_239416 [Collybiopsis luxurians FD-317 M1]